MMQKIHLSNTTYRT